MQEDTTEHFFTKTQALLLTLLLLGLIGSFIIKLQTPPHVPLLLCIFLLIIIGFLKKANWKTMEQGIVDGVKPGLVPILIFLLIGTLIGVWMASGTVPTMMVYGFYVLSAHYFLPAALVISAIVGTCIGSSLTTVATIGVALMGMGTVMDINPAWVAGAVISGAFFGDKMSPLSDTTNLAPTLARIDLFTHIRHLLWTTVPALLISLVLFLLIGNGSAVSDSAAQVEGLRQALEQHAIIHPAALIPPVLLFILAMLRVPAVPTLIAGILSGIAIAFWLNPVITAGQMATIIQNGFVSETGIKAVDSLLTRGGMQSMMFSVSLIFLALSMGGLLYRLGIINRLMEMVHRFIATRGRLIASTALSSIGINVLLGEQYLSIVLPGNAFVQQYEKLGLERKNMARVLEDAGTVVNPLVPWSVCGVFLSEVLGVPTIEYLPFAFFCLLCPILTIFLGFTGIGIAKKQENKQSLPLE
ncbi:Na+/H+ antiporter NhaC [Aneurinibacillus aneurinilyticus]|uniref:Na+/H+ antiporter NhaC n=1 Tax=Aneurinibacillus aneurinilyticus TaxID=1391 RepID=UPI00041E9DB5|nr:Na+/H+ antiporter NhaC [Aneurinibacillus aneurinilyticus]MCI1693549.1 Na+/H+ antiporter NhaC [Aneurinibacillus aneurinilyticus]MED0706108.1 Na+/H+ antiporter NhaC [Aneurinibacillus aneurinilyticus]MED0725082.1 Na+/H+ antiporter NhaC [Aneurinibacillus aneurinilyticus]MED0732682.1 Na+/H+ antiporter NhaC [Aneurinibacillus aneurinilyticus]MED0739819.1 Na+/H+ antiporter NhaC [Aneurinibacillus aneurinilyticus]